MIEPTEMMKLAALAKIALSESEGEELRGQVGAILEHISEIHHAGKAQRTREPDTHRNIFREDTVPHERGVFSLRLLAAAPDREGKYIRVKKIL
jgi:aspartyl/glutamyl-tRNA(Asn/Gln) amidotransferase C subunit